MEKKTKIIVAMSGGVDSSVAAALLVEQGFDVTGVFMKNWSVPINGELVCPWEQDSADARAVADKLGIPFYVLSFEDEYKIRVVDYMVDEYSKGRTPNPDVMCNSEIKFNLFLDKALSLGADYVATGHYARVREENSSAFFRGPRSASLPAPGRDLSSSKGKKNFLLLKGLDQNKDQSYFLYRLGQEQLSKLLFPIGEYEKPEVRELARKFDLPTAEKKDSTGVCFIGEFSMKDFLKHEIELNNGPVVDIETGAKIAEHEGIQYYTIGQRHGFGGGGGVPYYVARKDFETNTIYAAPDRMHGSLMSNEIEIEDLHWINASSFLLTQESDSRLRENDINITAKIRYRGEDYKVEKIDGNHVVFKTPVWAATPGQSIVFYEGDICLGGAIIRESVISRISAIA